MSPPDAQEPKPIQHDPLRCKNCGIEFPLYKIFAYLCEDCEDAQRVLEDWEDRLKGGDDG